MPQENTRKILDDVTDVPLFEGLSQESLEALATVAQRRHYERGQTLFSEGDPGEGFYILLTGRVKVFKLSPEGKEQILHIILPGEPFAEVAVFTGRRYPAYAEALENVSTLFFPRTGFVNLITQSPALALNMLAVLSLRLKKFARMIEDLSLREVPGRLAAYLLLSSARAHGAADIELDLTKGQLASLLGTIPETLSRIFARMSRQGLIESKGPTIRLLNRDGLEALAEGRERLT